MKTNVPGISFRTLPILDITPDAFSFTDQFDTTISTPYESNIVTITGINAAANVSVSIGEYRINAGTWVSAPGVVNNNDTLQVRHTSSSSASTAVNQVVTVGGGQDTFSTTTAAGAAATAKYEIKNTKLPPGAVGSQTFIPTSVGFGTPTGAILIRAGHWQSFTHFEANHNMSIGATNVTNTSTISWMMDGETPGPTKCFKNHDNIRLATRRQSSVPNPREGYKIVSFGVDGMTIEVTESSDDGTGDHEYEASVIFFTGTGIEAFEPWFLDDMGTTATAQTVGGLDNPSMTFVWSSGLSVPVATVSAETTGAGYPSFQTSFGVATKNGDQHCMAFSGQDSVMTVNSTSALYNNAAVAAVDNNAEIYKGTIGNWTATGFDITSSSNSGNRIVGGVAIKLHPSIKATIVPIDIPATGDYIESSLTYTPELAVGAITQGVSVRNTPQRTNHCTGIIAFADRVRTHAVSDMDDIATNDRQAHSMSDVAISLWDPIYVSGNVLTKTLEVGSGWGTTSNFTSSGWTMTRGVNGAAKGFAVAFGQEVSLRLTNPFDFETIPHDSMLSYASGQHTGPDASAVLNDTGASFGSFTGLKVKNSSKPISLGVFGEAIITSNTGTQITAPLSGSKLWDTGDYYQVLVDISVGEKIEYEDITNLGGVVIANKVGQFEITGTSGVHTFRARIVDGTNVPQSDWFTITTNITRTFT
jgi:hypothetical protein